MKVLATLLLLIPVLSFGQDCKYRMHKVDEFTNKATIYTKLEKIGPSLRVQFVRIGDEKYMRMKYDLNIGCASSDSYVILKYENDSTEKLMYIGETNCSSPVFASLLPDNIDSIKKVRIRHSRSYRDVKISKPSFLIKGVKCLD